MHITVVMDVALIIPLPGKVMHMWCHYIIHFKTVMSYDKSNLVNLNPEGFSQFRF